MFTNFENINELKFLRVSREFFIEFLEGILKKMNNTELLRNRLYLKNCFISDYFVT